MTSGKIILLSIIIFSTINCAGQTNISLIGEWAGRLKDSSGEFEYKLKLESEESGIYTGVSISLSANFYCESKVKAVKQNGRLIVSEIEVLKTNYPNKQELCLLNLVLTIADSKLLGNYSPSNNTSNCLSGNVALNKITSPLANVQALSSKKSTNRTSTIPDFKNSTSVKNIPTAAVILEKDSLAIGINDGARVEYKLRVIEIDADEAELTILDNMAVDGDIVTLIDNDNLIFRKVTLSKIPLSYKITNIQSSVHLIKFYAENLGAIPPNTGVLIVKTRNSLVKTNFSSDLNQTATIQINLKKAL